MLLNNIRQQTTWDRVPDNAGLSVGPMGFIFETPDLPKSMLRSRDHWGFFRAEVASGDANPRGIPGWRSEMSINTRIPNGKENWFSVCHALMTPDATNDTITLVQCHNTQEAGDTYTAGPPLEIRIEAVTNKLLVIRRYDARPNTTSIPTEVEEYRSADPYVRGVLHRLVIRCIFDPTGTTGAFQVWMDGVLIVNSIGVSVGFNDVNGNYWKTGIYYYGNSGPFWGYIINPEFSYNSLYGRVIAPKAAPELTG